LRREGKWRQRLLKGVRNKKAGRRHRKLTEEGKKMRGNEGNQEKGGR
jgi:hypothetical protein